MPISLRYQVNAPHIIYEKIENEIVLVNLTRGHYYSLQNVGAVVWDYLADHASVEEIISIIQQSYVGDPNDIEESIRAFIKDLESADMILEFDDSAMDTPAAPTLKEGDKRLSFEPPLIESYTDMEDLLLLDPIHEVDETGWPSKHTINRDLDA